ncbi:hypothetical protein BC939DRAFT_456016 [Gamsiella multidivaricata]|uniref:uncharacterized protein n=1 Tax=Gamsiella multidivaricata TaxID=101098 RepID=UPI00221F49C6|nr:uncharacterized protein BC939DRAFT_456016 [Gamsiella multidivaricata]KAI7821181.1 hypothetical protein BC939DRAFT_456016 [Gamsiella multidivaricata]
MAKLLNAKEWFKRRRGKKKRSPTPTNVYIPGIGYPPLRNSSQPTLIPYVPPSATTSEIEDDEDDNLLPAISQDMISAATTTCLGMSRTMVAAIATPPSNTDAEDLSQYRNRHAKYHSLSLTPSAVTVPGAFPLRRSSLQQPFASRSYNSLPTQITEMRSCPQPGQRIESRQSLSRNLNYLTSRHLRRNSEQTQTTSQPLPQPLPQPQPQQPLLTHAQVKSPNALKAISTGNTTSAENLAMLETKAQEYARTVKTLWQMVENEDLAYRLRDASPVEREWLIYHHKNANFPFKPIPIAATSTPNTTAPATTTTATTTTTAATAAGRASSDNGRARVHFNNHHHVHNRGLEPIAETGAAETDKDKVMSPGTKSSFHHRPQCHLSKHVRQHSQDGGAESVHAVTMSLPNSPMAGPVMSSTEMAAKKATRRCTLLSPTVLQSAQELQKRDHFTIQERVDMEEDWRMQAKLMNRLGESQGRSSGARRVHAQLLQRQQRQVQERIEYEPTHEDFNKWYDLKEEIEDDEVPEMNQVRVLDLKEEFEDEEDRQKRIEQEKQQELEQLEHELNILGLDRFEGMCMSFVEPEIEEEEEEEDDGPSSTSSLSSTSQQQMMVALSPEELHQQLQAQYHQLQEHLLEHQRMMQKLSELKQQRQQGGPKVRVKVSQKKRLAAGTMKVPPPPPPMPMPMSMSMPMPLAPAMGKKSLVVEPLRPRNGRRLFSPDCDSMIIKDFVPLAQPAPPMPVRIA